MVKGVRNELYFKLYDLLGRLKMKGVLSKPQSIIELDKTIENGIYKIEFKNEDEIYTTNLLIRS